MYSAVTKKLFVFSAVFHGFIITRVLSWVLLKKLFRLISAYAEQYLNIDPGVLGMAFNKAAARRYFITHQHAENFIGIGKAFNGDLF